MVIFTEFCRTDTGNFSLGIEVIHKRKLGLIYSVRPSTIASSLGNQDTDKWQFASKIHSPLFMP
jgi:hypothetical protein